MANTHLERAKQVHLQRKMKPRIIRLFTQARSSYKLRAWARILLFSCREFAKSSLDRFIYLLIYLFYLSLNNSLKIHEENTKKITAVSVIL